MKGRQASLVYLAANLLAASVPFALLPVLVRLIGQAEYGQVAIFHALVNMALAVVGVNTVGAVKRHYFDTRNAGATDEESYARFIGATMIILAGSFALSVVTVLALGHWMERFTGLDVRMLLLGLIVAASTFVVNIRLSDYQVRGRAIAYGVVQVGMAITNLVLSLAILFWFLRSAEGRILGIAFSVAAAAAIALVSLQRSRLIDLRVEQSAVKDALAFGLPLVPHAFGVFLIASADRFFIKSYSGLAEVGIYATAVQITFLLRVVHDAINKSFQPYVFDRLSRANDKKEAKAEEGRRVVGAFYQVSAVTVALAGLLALAGPFVATLLLGEGYSAAGGLIPVLALGTACHGGYLYLINVMLYARRTGVLASSTILLALLNLGLLFLLVPRWGMDGAAWAFAVTSLVRLAMVGWLSHRAWPLPWTKPRFFGLRD